ncbi:MAG: hypothetical protein ACYDH6_01660 [Acidimicrobiales bacterium]
MERAALSRLGLITAEQALAAGVSAALIRYHARPEGRWARVLPRVYAVRAAPDHPSRPFLAALLWAGPGAVLSHRAAAVVLGLDGVPSALPELWSRRTRPPTGVIGHRGSVEPTAIIRRGPLTLTTVARTILDLGAVLDEERLELAVESGLRRDRALEPSLRERSAPATLRRVMERRPPNAPPTESELETRFLQVTRLVDLPPPVRQYPVLFDGRCIARLDFCWPEAGLWVELDGRATHDNATAFYADRRRQNDVIALLRWQLLRFGWHDVVDHPMVAARKTLALYRVGLATPAVKVNGGHF